MRLDQDNPYSIDDPAEELFYGREMQVAKLARQLQHPRAGSLALIGGRRFGKTSLLLAIERQLWRHFVSGEQDGTSRAIPVPINLLQGETSSLRNFYLRVISQFGEQLDACPSAEFSRNWDLTLTSHGGRAIDRVFADKLVDICRDLSRNGRPTRVVLLVDEIEQILEKSWKGRLFSQLRHLIYDNRRTRSYCRIVFTGSSEFYYEIKSPGSPLGEVLRPEFLSAFSLRDTLRLIQEPCGSLVSPDIADEIARYSGGNPYIVQYFMFHLWDHLPEITPEQPSQLLNQFLAEKNHILQKWYNAIGDTGQEIYRTLSLHDGWCAEDDIRLRTPIAASMKVTPALNALCYHGLAIRDEGLSRYCVNGDLFRTWFAKNTSSSGLEPAVSPGTGTSLDSDAVATGIEQIQTKLGEVHSDLKKEGEETRRVVRDVGESLAKQFEDAKLHTEELMKDLLDETERATIDAILRGIDGAADDDDDLKEELQRIEQALRQIQQAFDDDRINVQTQENLQVISEPGVGFKHKLKLTVPLIPFVLGYEGEIELAQRVNLEQALMALKRRFGLERKPSSGA